jgi:processive 1,2-diacylglycerol beta-glucosyltransferase
MYLLMRRLLKLLRGKSKLSNTRFVTESLRKTMRHNSKARILILTAGFGSGHNKVAQALQASLLDEGAGHCELLDFFELAGPYAYRIAQFSNLFWVKWSPWLYGCFYWTMDHLHPDSWPQRALDRFGSERISAYIDTHSPDIVVCVYPTPARVLARNKVSGRFKGSLAVTVTDYRVNAQWLHGGVDLYLVAHDNVKDNLVKWGIDRSCVKVTGIPIDGEFSTTNSTTSQNSSTEPRIPLVVVMGSGYRKATIVKLAQACVRTQKRMRLLVQCGQDVDFRSSIGGLSSTSVQVTAVGYIDNMCEVMSTADILVTKAGGITVTEALSKRLPMIIHQPIPGQERGNAEFLATAGAAIITRDVSGVTQAVGLLLSSSKRVVEMKTAAARLSQPLASKIAAREILSRIVEGTR